MRYPTPDGMTSTRASAHALLAIALLQACAIWFHPQAPADSADTWMHGLAAIAPQASHLHLLLVASVVAAWLLLGALGACWPSPAMARGAERLYGLGAAAMVAGAMINGFALGRFAQWATTDGLAHADAAPAVAMFAFSLNQALAGFGLVATSLAILLWSLGVRASPGPWSRATHRVGVGISALCVAGYAIGLVDTDVAGIATVTLAQCAWYALAALTLLRGGIAPAQHPLPPHRADSP